MRLLAPPNPVGTNGVSLDASQARAVAAALAGQGLLVAGAPGTGKTTVLRQIAIGALQKPKVGTHANLQQVLLLAPTRRAATELRHQIGTQIAGAMAAPVVRTASAVAFHILKTLALANGEPAPRMISGAEQDRVLADLLAGHLAGDGTPLHLPPGLKPEVLALRGFRNELRDILMRVRENGLTPAELIQLGIAHNRPMWELGGELFAEYEATLALQSVGSSLGRQLDPAALIADAAVALANWETLTSAPLPRFDIVLVDDYQEVSAATVQLISELQAAGSQLVLAGDADLTAQGYRGADPTFIGKAAAPMASAPGAFGLDTIVLPTVWRYEKFSSGQELRDVAVRITSRIPTVGGPITRTARIPTLNNSGTTRNNKSIDNQEVANKEVLSAAGLSGSSSREQPPAVQVVKLRGVAQEAAWIAAELRKEHFLHQTPWDRMAVICRSGAQLADLRRELIGAGVPVATLGAEVPLHQEPAVAPLLLALKLVTCAEPLTIEVLLDLLASPIGAVDAIGLRRLRQSLLAEERAAGGTRSSDQLLLACLTDSVLLKPLRDVGVGLKRVVRALDAGVKAYLETKDVSSVLWEIWAATGLAQAWRSSALAGGSFGVRADRDLDAVMALFKAAEFYTERNPGAGPLRFVEFLQSHEVPADSVAISGQNRAVAALTPVGAAGGEWEVVAVAGVQEGVWPDLRLRGSMFGTAALVDQLNGRSSENQSNDIVTARKEVLADETRAFAVAVTRAQRRLLVTAVEGPDDIPSNYLDLVADEVRLVHPGPPLDLRGVVASARNAQTGGPASGDEAAMFLAALWAAGVDDANPENWYGANPVSTVEPLWQPDGPLIPVSPSKVQAVVNCPLRWSFENAGAARTAGVAQSVGTLIHTLAQDFPNGTQAELRQELDRRWPELDMGDGWVAQRERAKAEAMVDRLAAYLKDAKPAALVEGSFKLPIESALLSGRADRIEDLGAGNFQIVDIKTGSTLPSGKDTEQNPQLSTYQLALASGAFGELPTDAKASGAQLLYVSSGKEGTIRKQAQIDEAGLVAAKQLVVSVAQTMSGSKFEARVNKNCRNCAVKFACPLQAVVSDLP